MSNTFYDLDALIQKLFQQIVALQAAFDLIALERQQVKHD